MTDSLYNRINARAGGAHYDAEEAAKANERTIAFLHEHLG